MEVKELSDVIERDWSLELGSIISYVGGTVLLGLGFYGYYKTNNPKILIPTLSGSAVFYSLALWCKAVKDRIYKFRASNQESEKHSIEINRWWDERIRSWNNESKNLLNGDYGE